MHLQLGLGLIVAACTCSALVLDGQNCSLSESQKLTAMQLTNLFENGAFNFDYGEFSFQTLS